MTKLPETTCDSPIIPARVMWWMLGVLVVFAFPLFVCSPVTSDTSLFDLQAMNVQRAGFPTATSWNRICREPFGFTWVCDRLLAGLRKR